MAIDAMQRKAMAVGTMLTAKYKGVEYTAEVVAGEGGKARYRLTDGREFKSPSAAGSAVMGGQACNGWRFWSLEGAEQPETSQSTSETAPRPAQTPGGAPARVRPQCPRCAKSFVGEKQLAHHEANADRLCAPV